MLLIISIGIISLAIGIILGNYEIIEEFFNIPSTNIDLLEEFLEQYVAGIPIPPPI